MAYGYIQPGLSGIESSAGKVSLGQYINIPYLLSAILAAAVILAVLFALERWRPWRKELGNNYEGYFVHTPEKIQK